MVIPKIRLTFVYFTPFKNGLVMEKKFGFSYVHYDAPAQLSQDDRELVAAETLTVDLELVDSGAADPRTDPAEDAMNTVSVTVAKADA